MFHSLTILGFGFGTSETEIKVHYHQFARKYHPNKNDPTITGLTPLEATDFFKLLNNALLLCQMHDCIRCSRRDILFWHFLCHLLAQKMRPDAGVIFQHRADKP